MLAVAIRELLVSLSLYGYSTLEQKLTLEIFTQLFLLAITVILPFW